MALTFGTAGIRGPLGPGPDQINVATIALVAAGLAEYLASAVRERGDPSGQASVVIGYDARHQSDEFAAAVGHALSIRGHRVAVLPRALPTPVLAFAVRHTNADCGVMITASHNPATDNGLKVYLGGRLTDDDGRGAQIAPPTDERIQESIRHATPQPGYASDIPVLDESVIDAYVRSIAALVSPPVVPASTRRRSVEIVLTPLHGVGGDTAVSVVTAAGFSSVAVVPEQAAPNPAFPTVAFPNPEEPGTMDLAISLAERSGADVVLALDPDADRCAVATVIDGYWTTLHGDRLGCLLGEWIAGRVPAQGPRVLASSFVSSRLLGAIAARHGLPFVTTLTGFKWLARVPGLAFAYEEALGYCVAPGIVRDKDGISAALLVAEYVSELAARGRTLADELDHLDLTYGVHVSRPVTMRVGSPAASSAMVARLIAHPPESLGGSLVASVTNLDDGLDGLPPTPGVCLILGSGDRVMVRPSGTEPKAKAYLEVVRPASPDLRGDRSVAAAAMDALEVDVRTALHE